ncbi:hypothetical protein [Nucisporomicrobium flavum]|uniref:hypothetical protein n=1 Tax=Nucisporomicrobium flavum TaxID=2785915 RepID=UPI001F38D576|nr:hypothetical protein [Nucisporomicrobium flavum]
MTNVKQTIVDAASFLARNQDGSGKVSAASRSGADVVDTAIESLLGARPENPEEFRTLLDRAFVVEEDGGRKVVRYRRPTTAGALMLKQGAVLTGAQASIVKRAQLARTEIFENLDALVPLALTPDPDAVRDVRSLVHTVVDAAVEEMSRPGGPTVVRVDRLLAELAGEDAVRDQAVPVALDSLDGLLKRLADVFGMHRTEVSSLDDERTYTSFVAIVGTVSSLCLGWVADRRYLDPLTGQPFLGTQLVQIERALAVVGQSVEEVRQALDRAEVEENERFLPPPIPTSGIYATTGNRRSVPSLGAVLAWTEDVAQRGFDRLRHGGRDGIDSFVSETGELTGTIRTVMQAVAPGPGAPRLTGLDSQPVRDALQSLLRRIDTVTMLARRLQQPRQAAVAAASPPPPPSASTMSASGGRSTSSSRRSGRSRSRGAARSTVAIGGPAAGRPPAGRPPAGRPLAVDAVDAGRFVDDPMAAGVQASPSGSWLRVYGAGFDADTSVDLTSVYGTVYAASRPIVIDEGQLIVASGPTEDIAVVKVHNSTGAVAELRLREDRRPLTLTSARLGKSAYVADGDAAGPNTCLYATLYGSGFDPSVHVAVVVKDQVLSPAQIVVLGDAMLELVVGDFHGTGIDKIVVTHPDGRKAELDVNGTLPQTRSDGEDE